MIPIRLLTLLTAIALSLLINSTYGRNYRNLSQLPNKELLQLGHEYSRVRNMPDSALLVYTLLTHRNTPDISTDKKKEMIDAFNGLWYTYFFFYFDFKSGNQALMTALDLCDETGMSKGRTYFGLGCMYQGMSEVAGNNTLCKESQEYYRKAFQEVINNGDGKLLVSLMANLITVSHMLGDTSLARKEMAIMKSSAKKLGIDDNWIYRYTCQLYDGFKALETNECEKAEKIFASQSDLIDDEITKDNFRYLLFSLLNQSSANECLGNYEKSMECLDKALQLSIIYDGKDYRLQTYEAFANHYINAGNKEKWIESRNKYLELKDSLLNYQQYASVKEMSMYDHMREIDREMEALKHREDIHNNIIRISGVIFLGIIILLVAIFIRNRYLKRINHTLYAKNMELLRAEEERRMLIKEEAEANSTATSEADAAEPADNVRYKNSILDETQSDEILKKILLVMEESDEIYQQGFKIDTLAKLTGVNYKHLSQVINEKRGCNFNVFLNEYRVKRACRLINTTGNASLFTIEGLANQVGFRSRNAFATAFKKFTGLNPSAYLKIAKSSENDH